MSMKITEVGGFGNRIRVSNDIVDVEFARDFGPRIMYYGLCGKHNMFYENTDLSINKKGGEMERFGEGSKWYIYGGHRFWQAPEKYPRTYLPDSTPIEYEINGNTVILKQKKYDLCGTQAQVEFTLSENSSEVKVVHKVTNLSEWEVTLAPWAISVMAQGSTELFFKPTEDTGLLANTVVTFWPYSKLNDERVSYGENYIMLRQDTNIHRNFKIGITSEDGKAYVYNDGCLFTKYFGEYDKTKEYPDFGMNFETYTSDKILECESVSYLRTLKNGETAEHTEVWTLEEKELEEILK